MTKRKDETDQEYRARRADYVRKRRADPEVRARQADYDRKRRADPEVRAREAAYARRRPADSATVRGRKNSARRVRYANDADYRERQLDRAREHFAKPEVRAWIADYSRKRRARFMAEETTEGYRERVNTHKREYRAANPDVRKREAERLRKAQRCGDSASGLIVRLRTPPWIGKEERKALAHMALRRNAPEGHEIDHIVPLSGKLIAGLHVPDNLQYLTHDEHRRKTNAQRPYTQEEAERLVARGVAVWRKDIGAAGEIDWQKYQPVSSARLANTTWVISRALDRGTA